VPPECSRAEYLSRLLELLPEMKFNARFCDVFCDPNYFPLAESRTLLERAKALGFGLHLHAGQFWEDGGVDLGIELGARAMGHLDHISKEESARLGTSPTAAVLLPGVTLFGHSSWPTARRMIDDGVIVAVASNFNPGSCPSLSMPLMIGLACMGMHLSPAEALNAATINAAYALDLKNVGSLELGRQADAVILDHPDYRMIPYYFGVNPVSAVVKKGRIAWQR
jgi:imidazolonepropionase